MTIATRTELPAAERFSARIDPDGVMAELPDMQELSLLRAESAKQIETQSECRINLGLDREKASAIVVDASKWHRLC